MQHNRASHMLFDFCCNVIIYFCDLLYFAEQGLPDSHSKAPPSWEKLSFYLLEECRIKYDGIWLIRRNLIEYARIYVMTLTCWYPSINGKSGKRSTERQDRESPASRAHFTLTCRYNGDDFGQA